MSFAPATDIARDIAEVRRVVASAGSSFAAGMRILPAMRRRAIHSVYALCRVVDDIADGDAPGCADPGTRARLLDDWDDEIARTFAGSPRTAIGAEIARSAERHALPRREFELILEGMRMDADAIVAPSAQRLDAYVRRVAGAAGILSMRCFGAWSGPPSERFALNLARGLQLTNILRDVEEDARRGRLYLPRHVLDAAGLPHDPAGVPGDPRLPAARAALGAEARAGFKAAAAEIPAHRRVPLLPALMMMGPYERLLRRWEADWAAPPPPRSRWGKVADGVATATRLR
ncbi:farnesyl-diphosphate farnesyltransferase [Hasllibacter halocynthiae]|uniref:Farnesyl-diphosphate farnesyltransferase n=1 Tax=Hasllibacter halocynthiae TaxID=595589 RepID=A0A2T0X2A8_9RHOB|nr:squalene/phytoene synthase family protein [Hasllibacter halocynthiae]PRY93089.1 farnesyl-diphosphate farnesyltransferase [Hasllibacter halocynthiae]